MKKLKFTRNGKILEVSDPAHVDCLKAKGWECPALKEDAEADKADDKEGKKQ